MLRRPKRAASTKGLRILRLSVVRPTGTPAAPPGPHPVAGMRAGQNPDAPAKMRRLLPTELPKIDAGREPHRLTGGPARRAEPDPFRAIDSSLTSCVVCDCVNHTLTLSRPGPLSTLPTFSFVPTTFVAGNERNPRPRARPGSSAQH